MTFIFVWASHIHQILRLTSALYCGRYFNIFLAAHAPEVSVEIRASYVDTMSKYYHSKFKRYTCDLLKLQMDVATKHDLVPASHRLCGCPSLPLSVSVSMCASLVVFTHCLSVSLYCTKATFVSVFLFHFSFSCRIRLAKAPKIVVDCSLQTKALRTALLSFRWAIGPQ